MIKTALMKDGPGADASRDAAECALRKFGMAMMRHAGDRIFELNLTMPQMKVLRAIERLGRASGRQLADEFGVSPAAIVPVCDRLQSMDLVRRVADSNDRRIRWFELTREGTSTLDVVSARVRSRIRPALAALSADDRVTLARILDGLADALGGDAAERRAQSRR